MGTFLTADHVIESVRRRSKRTAGDQNEIRFEIEHPDICPVLLLGLGLVYGQPVVPPSALCRVPTIRSPIREREDPLAVLSGRREIEAASDIAVMRAAEPIPEEVIRTVGGAIVGRRT